MINIELMIQRGENKDLGKVLYTELSYQALMKWVTARRQKAFHSDWITPNLFLAPCGNVNTFLREPKRSQTEWSLANKDCFSSSSAQTCPPPPGLTANSANTTSYMVGQTVPINCPRGLQVKGRHGRGTVIITCRNDQTWTPIRAVCESKLTSSHNSYSY